MLPVYTECLTKAEYGVADIITQSANLLMPLISLGICEAVFRYTLDTANDRREVLTTGFVIILFGLGVMLALYPLLDTIEFFDGYNVADNIIRFPARTCTRCSRSIFARAG